MFIIDESNSFRTVTEKDIYDKPLNYHTSTLILYTGKKNLHQTLIALGFLRGHSINYILLISPKIEMYIDDIWFALNGTKWLISKKPTSIMDAKKIINTYLINIKKQENLITIKQLKYLKYLLNLNKNKYLHNSLRNEFDFQIEELTKGAAGLLIHHAKNLTPANLDSTLKKFKKELNNE